MPSGLGPIRCQGEANDVADLKAAPRLGRRLAQARVAVEEAHVRLPMAERTLCYRPECISLFDAVEAPAFCHSRRIDGRNRL